MWRDLLFGALFAMVLAAILLAVGERVRALLRMPCSPWLRPALAWGMGSWSIGLAVLALGLFGLLRPVPLLVLLIAAAAFGRWSRLIALARKLLVPALASVPLLPVALAPPFFYDSWVYHLGLPWQALQAGSLEPHPGNLFSTFPPLAQLVYTAPLAWGFTRAPALLHLVGYCAAAAALGGLARRLGAARIAALAAGVSILYLPGAPLLAGFPAAEAWAVLGILAAVALALAGPRGALAAGWMAGIACASRLQGLPWVALVASIVVARRRRPIAALAVFLLGAVAGSAPWWLKNAALLRDPLAPLGWRGMGIDTLWRDATSNLNLAASWPALLESVARSLAGSAWLLAPLLVTAVVLAACATRGRFRIVVVTSIAACGALVWALTGALPRFLAPCLALLLAAAVCGRGRVGLVTGSLAVSWVLLPGVHVAQAVLREFGGLSLLGPAPAVYSTLVVSDPSPGFRACASLPEDARVLLVGEPRGFLFPRRFETGSQHDPSPLVDLLRREASPEAAATRLHDLGYTHLLVNVPEMRRLGERYPVLPWTDSEGRSRFVELTRHLGPPVLLQDETVVYALVTTPSARRARPIAGPPAAARSADRP